MSRILLAGVGPLPGPLRERVFAPGLRLATFLRALLARDHEVALLELPFGGIESGRSEVDRELLSHDVAALSVEDARRTIERILSRHAIDGVIALTDVCALAAAQSAWEGPLYVDWFGSPMAERQQQAWVHRSDESLADAWRHVLPVLLRADRFSVCSKPQRHALLGELGAAGRLNSQTCGIQLIDIVPPAVGIDREPEVGAQRPLADAGIHAPAKAILSTGGFNTWFDEETFFHGVQKVLLSNAEAHLAITGGRIDGHVSAVFDRFKERVDRSPARTRIHFLGWIGHAEFLAACREAHVAVSCDHDSVEGELGCRNRVLGWLWQGLRVVSTALDPFTEALAAEGFVRTYEPADQRGLAEALAQELELPKRTAAEVVQVRRWLQQHHGAESVAAPAAAWAERLALAPDRSGGAVDNPLADMQRRFLANAAPTVDRATQAKLAAAQELAARLRGSRLFKATLEKRPEIRDLLDRIED